MQDTHSAMTCYYPEAYGVEAPSWICGQTPTDIELMGVGLAKKSAGGMSLMRKRATENARADLAAALQTDVNDMLTEAIATYKEVVVENGAETSVDKAEENIERVLQTVVSKTLANTRVAMVTTDPKGNMYALVSMDKPTYDQHVNEVIDSVSNSDSELWNQFNNEKAQEDLAAAFQALKK
ncbi:hypothetical protein JCM19231_2763 [Vibrio ishigakensis]|uniref:Lipoprotein LPP20-like domain-containing protein n=1 Tax=Vibrio ishigakensis TaxID=1481914 RepID=A0A0B8NVY9_9VIBR|nr:hypothetical protein JCM19231_2763 [Vibrio ishigakensis]